jgi:diguanylate cyclase (GGDEF)-like protein
LLRRLDHTVGALRQANSREHVLGDLGTALLRTTDTAGVHRLAVRAAAELLPSARTSLISVNADDPDTVLVVTAEGAERMPAEVIPSSVLDGHLVPGSADRPTLLPLLNGARFFGVLSVRADGPLPADLLKAFEALRTQVSLALSAVALTETLTMQAMHDTLTGLGNRALLRDRLTGALARAHRTGRPVAALLLDLNGFKPINDTYGHDAGDEVLRIVADRLRQSVRTEDTVGRLGGDEFVVIAEDLHSAQDAIVIAERIIDSLNEAAPVAGHALHTPASIGIALSHVGTETPDDLLHDADTAMYEAKRAGNGRYRLHNAPAQHV